MERSVMNRLLFAAFLLVSLCQLPAALAQKPEDIKQLDRHMTAMTKDGGPTGATAALFKETVTRMLNKELDRLGLRRHLSNSEHGKLTTSITQHISKALRKIDKATAGRRSIEMVNALRLISSRRWLRDFIFRWLGFPRIGQLKSAAIGTGESKKRQGEPSLSIERSRLDLQASVISRSGAWKAVLDSSRVMNDIGGPGTGNGRIDAGEWAQLGLVLENVSKRRMFSSSAWLHTTSSCLWLDPGREYELMEAEPSGGQVGFKAWVYISSGCQGRKTFPIAINIRDSADANTGSINIAVKARLATGVIADRVFDTDTPGFSDGSDLKDQLLFPGMSFEFRAGFNATTFEPIEGYTYYAFEPVSAPLFAEMAHAFVPMPRLIRRFSAGDDLDVRVADEKAYAAWQRRAARGKFNARTSPDSKTPVWLAMEVVVFDEIARKPKPRPAQQRVEEGSNRCEPVMRLNLKALAGLLSQMRKRMEIRARPVNTSSPNGVAAVSGYELVITEKGMKDLLAKLASAKGAVGKGCVSEPSGSKVTARASASTATGGSKPRGTLYDYNFRYLIPFFLGKAAPEKPVRARPAVKKHLNQVEDVEIARREGDYPRKISQAVQPKRGCGCTATGDVHNEAPLFVGLIALALAFRRGRRWWVQRR